MGEESREWRGVPLSEIYGSQSPWGAPEFPLVSPAFDHTVIYHVPCNGIDVGGRPPKPQIGQDKWDHDFVRMPCSSQSLYPVENNGVTSLKQRWNIIREALEKPMECSQDLAEAILSYNTKFKTVWRFRALHKLFNEYLEEEESQYFFSVTLPEIAKLALSLPKLIQAPIPLLKQHKNKAISLSQLQIASLLANAFFCTFPRRNTFKRTSEYASYPHINFNTLYESSGSEQVLEKLKCLCHYFRRVCTKVPGGVLTFARRSVPPRQCPAWGESPRPLASSPLHASAAGTIEDEGLGLLQIDFANKYLGGGVLNRGCVQEEIRFVICPELLVSMLFTEVLRPNEALLMIGCERYSRYTGYGDTFRFAGDYTDRTPADSSGRRRCAVLAIDALPFADPARQYRPELLIRELNKAWVGFSSYADQQSGRLQRPGVATGNWGCGAFGGSTHLKALLQIMAAAEARRPMAYFTFGDVELRNNIINMYNLLATHNVTVGQLYKILVEFSATDTRESQLYAFIHQSLLDRSRASDEPMDTSTPSNAAQGPNNSPDLFSQEYDDSADMAIDTSKDAPDSADRRQANIAKHSTASEKNQGPVRISKFFEGFKKIDGEIANGSKNTSEMTNLRTAKPVCKFSLVDEMDRLDQESGFSNYSDAKRRKSVLEAEPSLHGSNETNVTVKTVTVDNSRSSNLGADDSKSNATFQSVPTVSVEQNTIQSNERTQTESDRNSERLKRVQLPNSEIGCLGEDGDDDGLGEDDSQKITVSNEVKKKISKKITDYFSRKT